MTGNAPLYRSQGRFKFMGTYAMLGLQLAGAYKQTSAQRDAIKAQNAAIKANMQQVLNSTSYTYANLMSAQQQKFEDTVQTLYQTNKQSHALVASASNAEGESLARGRSTAKVVQALSLKADETNATIKNNYQRTFDTLRSSMEQTAISAQNQINSLASGIQKEMPSYTLGMANAFLSWQGNKNAIDLLKLQSGVTNPLQYAQGSIQGTAKLYTPWESSYYDLIDKSGGMGGYAPISSNNIFTSSKPAGATGVYGRF